MLIRVFLHAEFISAMKTVQNPTILWKFAKNRKMISFGNFCSIFWNSFHWKMFLDGKEEQNIRKSHEKRDFFRWQRRQIKQN